MTQPPGTRERHSLSDRIRSHARNLRGKSLREGLGYLRQRLSLVSARLLRNVPRGWVLAQRMLVTAPTRVARELATVCYRVPDHDGPVTIFRVSERRWPGLRNPHEAWPRYLYGPVTYVDVPGDHGSMLRQPPVGGLARRIKEYLPNGQPA